MQKVKNKNTIEKAQKSLDKCGWDCKETFYRESDKSIASFGFLFDKNTVTTKIHDKYLSEIEEGDTAIYFGEVWYKDSDPTDLFHYLVEQKIQKYKHTSEQFEVEGIQSIAYSPFQSNCPIGGAFAGVLFIQ